MKPARANNFSIVIPAQAGIQRFSGILDSGLRRNDEMLSLWDSSGLNQEKAQIDNISTE